MKTKLFVLPIIIILTIILPNRIKAQEFPITTSTNVSVLGELGFDGTNYLFAFAEDSLYTLKVQFVSNTGALVGNKISLGYSGGSPLVEFDGTNYLVLWSGPKQMFNPAKNLPDTVFGQFISPSGVLVGNRFVVGINYTISSPKGGCLDYHNGSYLAVIKQNEMNYAVNISPAGVVSSPVQLSTVMSGDNNIAFDGTNYLLAWWGKGTQPQQDIYGQFISQSGNPIGNTFIIDDDDYYSDNPLSIAYDGTKYMVCFHVQTVNTDSWSLYSRFVTPSGTVDNRISIRDSTYSPSFAYTSFDGTNYLVTWADSAFSMNSVIKGRFFSKAGVPIDNNIFTIFSAINNNIPLFAGSFFINNKFIVLGYRMDVTSMQYGNIYGTFIPSTNSSLSPIAENNDEFTIYPNPAKDEMYIEIQEGSNARINIYNTLGIKLITKKINNQTKTKLDISTLKNGVYFVELNTSTKRKVIKIIVNR